MSLDPIKKLGRAIAGISNEQVTLQQNISAEDSTGLLQLAVSEQLVMSGTIQLVAQYYASTSFILDHPVQGALDSSVYALDGGYNALLTSTILTSNW